MLNKIILYKKYIYFIFFIILFIVIIIFFINGKSSNDLEKKAELSQSWNLDNWNYYEDNKITTSDVVENLEERLREEWKIEWATYLFDKNWFKDNWGQENFKINSNIRIEIDAWNTWLKEGTSLKLLIPWADFEGLINVPWRYRYSLYFKESWEQEIIITWKGLNNWKITKYINLK